MPASDPLSSKERARLRGEAHPLKPLVHVGKEGVTTALIRSIEQALSGRALLKVRVLEAAPDPVQDVAHAIAARVEGSTVLQVLGRTATLYRPMPEPKKKPAPATESARPAPKRPSNTKPAGTKPTGGKSTGAKSTGAKRSPASRSGRGPRKKP